MEALKALFSDGFPVLLEAIGFKVYALLHLLLSKEGFNGSTLDLGRTWLVRCFLFSNRKHWKKLCKMFLRASHPPALMKTLTPKP